MKNINFGQLHNSIKEYVAIDFQNNREKMKEIFKEYFSLLKSKPVLSEQFNLFNNIENTIKSDNTIMFVNENINYFNKYKKTDLNKANNEVLSLMEKFEIPVIEEYENKELFESIDNLIKLPKSPKNAPQRTNSFSLVVEHINKKEAIVADKEAIKESSVDTIVEDYNSSYSEGLNEEEIKILKASLKGDIDEQKSLFEGLKKDCIKMLNEDIKNVSDVSLKESYLDVKQTMLEMEYNKESFDKDIIKFVKFKSDFEN